MNKWASIARLQLLLLGLFLLCLGATHRVYAQPNLSGLGSIQADTSGLAAMQEGLEVLELTLGVGLGEVVGERGK